MNKKSKRDDSAARIMLALSAILVPMGVIVIDPMAGSFTLAFAGFLSFRVVIGSKKYRPIALPFLAVAVVMFAYRFPEGMRHMGSYRQRGQDAAATDAAKNFYNKAMEQAADSDSLPLSFSKNNLPKNFNLNPNIKITGKLTIFLIPKNEQVVSTMSFFYKNSRSVIKLHNDGSTERIEAPTKNQALKNT